MRWLKFIGIAVHYLVNTILTILLVAFVFLVIVLLRHGEVPIPQQLIDQVDEELASQGLKVEFDELQVDLRGILFAQGVEIYATGNSEPIFESDLLLVKMSLFRALIGDFAPTELSIANASFYCPAVISPDGQRQTVIKSLYLNTDQQGQDWQLNTFILEVLGARVQINGNVFTPLPGMDDSSLSPDKPLDVTGLYYEVCRELIELQQPFSEIEDLILEIDLSGERKGPLEILAQAFLNSYYNEDNKIKLGEGSVRLRAKLDADGILRADGLGKVWLNSLQWEDTVHTGFTEAHVNLANGLDGFTSMPLAADVYSYNIKAWGMPFDGAFASLDLQGMRNNGFMKGHVLLKSGRNWLAVNGPFRPRDQSGSFKLRARWNPTFFLQCTEIPPEDIPTGISVTGRPDWRASVEIMPGFKPKNTEFDITFGELAYDQIKLDAARVKGRITEDTLDLYSVALYASDYSVQGNYFQQFSTGDYRFQAKGTVWPNLLDVFITDQWWKDLWADIIFHETPPEATIDMSGQFGAKGAKNKIYGKATVRDVQYMSEPVKEASARIWQTPQHLDLFDFKLETNEGYASADLHWDYLPNGERNYISFLARTHVPLMQGAHIASPSVVPIAKKFPSEEIPYLDLAGLVYGEDSAHPNDLYLKGSVFFPGPFEFEDVRFDNGSFLCEVTPEKIIVSEGRLGLGGGKAALNTTVERQANGGFYVQNAKISILDAKLYGLYEAVPFLRIARAKQEAVEKIEAAKAKAAGTAPDLDKDSPPRTFEERYAGNVKLFFDTHGQLPDLNSFAGSGTLVLTDANLGQLHLLGGLSSFLYGVGLHLGTLNFTDAQTDFSLARSNIYFPNGKISGATGELVANGNFDIDADKLDFLITLHPFGNMETPIFEEIFTIFSPLANSIEVELKGTLTKPKFEVSITPFGIFTGQGKVADPNANNTPPLKNPQPASENSSE